MSIRAVAVARQPIYDRSFELHGYELLYRRPATHQVASQLGDQMTAEAVMAATDLDLLSDSRVPTYINVDRGLLLSPELPGMLPKGVVIEVLETIAIDDEVVTACRTLAASGFRLALDDFTFSPGCEPLLELAAVVKLDVQAASRREITDLYERCRRYGASLLAEKVETSQELSWTLDLGFDLFQGYRLARPELRQTQRLDSTATSHLRLATEVLNPDFDLARVEEIVRLDPALALQLMKLAGTGSAHGTRRAVRNLKEALVLAGERRVRGWISLLVLSRAGLTTPQSLEAGLMCARMCELLNPDDPSAAFTAAIVANFIDYFATEDAPFEQWLDPHLLAVALRHEGSTGRILADVQDFQRDPSAAALRTDLPRTDFLDVASQATRWSVEVLTSLAAS